MDVFTLTLVRHGQSEFNRENIIQGQLNVPLSDLGKQQATLLGCRLQNEVFTHVYSSDLVRASETAKGILKQNRASNCAIIEDRLLRERKFGTMEGKSVKCLKEAASKANLELKLFTPLNGETLQQVYERAIMFFIQLCEQFLDDTMQDVNCSADTSYSEMVQLQCSPSQEYKKALHMENWKSYSSACSSSVSTRKRNIIQFSAELVRDKFISDKKTENSFKCLCQQILLDALNSLNKNACISESNVIPTTSKLSGIIDTSQTRANVLVVSHGGLLSGMICYLVEICGCSLPKGPKQACTIAPNASFSKFVVNVKSGSIPQVKCLYFQDKQHLDQSYDSKAGYTEQSF